MSSHAMADRPATLFEEMDTLGDVTRVHARVRPQATAFAFEGRETSYAQLDAHASQVARALRAAGVGHGDRIAFVGKNCDQYFELLMGAAKAGAVMVPIGWRLAPAEMAFIAHNAEAKLLFVGPDVAATVAATPELADLPLIALEPHGDWPTYEAWRDAQSPEDPHYPVDPSDTVVQLYTSGTTGKPKGAMLTHHNLLSGRKLAAQQPMPWNEWGPDDVSLVAMPIAHIGGTGWGLVGLVNGAKGVIAREFDPFKVLDFIEKDRISKMFMVPAALQIVVRGPFEKTETLGRYDIDANIDGGGTSGQAGALRHGIARAIEKLDPKGGAARAHLEDAFTRMLSEFQARRRAGASSKK
jgi:long-chain acyl-CoA synthetase